MLKQFNLNQSLLWLIRIGVFVILFVPIVMNSMFFFPFIVPKNVLFRIAVEIIFIAYLALAHISPQYRPRFDKLFWAITAFVGANVLAMLFGIGWYSSFWGNYERMSGVFHLFHLYAFFFVIVNVFRTREDWHDFLTFSLFTSLLMTMIGFVQWLNLPFLLKSSGGTRLSGTVGNATFLAAYLLFHLFFILYFFAKEDRLNIKLLSYCFVAVDAFLVLGSILSQFAADVDWGFFNFFKAPVLVESFSYPWVLISYLLFQALIFAAWFWRSKPYVIRILLGVLFLAELFIFLNTQTRGAIIGLGIAVAFLAIVSLCIRIDRRIKMASAALLIVLIVAPFLLFALKHSSLVQKNNVLNRLANISLTDTTTQSRLLTWHASWQGWTESPKSFLIGYGPENYYYVFNKYFPQQIYRNAGSQVWFDRSHNIIFDVSVMTGVVGLAAYLSILGMAIWFLFTSFRRNGSLSSSWLLIALLIAYFGQDFFVFDTINSEILLYLVLGFSSFIASEHQHEEAVQMSKDRPINFIYLSTLVIVLLFGIFAINVKTLQANQYIYDALVGTKSATDYSPVKVSLLEKAVNEAVVGKFEARQQLADYSNSLFRSQNSTAEQAMEVYTIAVSELQKSITEEPLNIRHVLWLSTLYNAASGVDRTAPAKNIAMLQKAVYLSPTRQQVYFELGQAYALNGDLDNAIVNFKKGVDLSPSVIDSHWNLLALYIVAGKNDLADQEFNLMQSALQWTPNVDDYQKLISLYSRVKNYPKMIAYANQLITLQPSADAYAQLAALYAKVGDNQHAKEATQKAVALDPSFSAEAQKFLDQLNQGKLKEN